MCTKVDAHAVELYGQPLRRAEGVVHVTAVAREPDGLRVMRVGPAPKSHHDFFALELTRARVDAIVVSGSVLRAEPELRYDLSPDLAAWRRRSIGAQPPTLLVLTRGDLPPSHPVWRSDARLQVFTNSSAAAALRGRLPSHVELVGVAQPSARAALDHLFAGGCRSVSIEAGPTVAVPLYRAPARIDELVLTVFEGALVPDARGGAFLDETWLSEHFERLTAPTRIDETNGCWEFTRWRRREARPQPGQPLSSRNC